MVRNIPERAKTSEELTADVAELLDAVSHRLRRATRRQLDPLGTTWAQVRALRTLARHGEPMRMSELAERLRIARRSATSVVDELVERRLVERLPLPADRRAVTVAVTRSGSQLLTDLDQRRREAAAHLARTLGDRELVTLRDLLRRLDQAD